MNWNAEQIRRALSDISADGGLRIATVGPFVLSIVEEYEARIATLATALADSQERNRQLAAELAMLKGENAAHAEPAQHTESIVCPNCNHIELATVLHTAPWYSYVHDCTQCGYTIMESEWQTVEQMIQERTKE